MDAQSIYGMPSVSRCLVFVMLCIALHSKFRKPELTTLRCETHEVLLFQLIYRTSGYRHLSPQMALPVEMYLSDKLHLSKRSLDVNTDTSQQSQQQGDTKPDDGAKALVSKLETFF